MYKNRLPKKLQHLPIAVKSKINGQKEGRLYYSYEFYVENELIFSDNDFSPSPLYLDHKNTLNAKSIYSLLSFLTLQPGDTDDEYFKNYTETQLAFVDSGIADEIRIIIYDLGL